MKTTNPSDNAQQDFEKANGAIKDFFKNFKLGTLINSSGIRKTKGATPLTIMLSIFSLPFTGKNFFRGIVESKSESFGKDAAYDLLKCPYYNWRKLLLTLSVGLHSFFSPLTSRDRENVLIFDDSPYERSRSKKVELLANVFDHAAMKFIRGFRLLTVCWSDGVSLLPLDFVLLSSTKEKNRYQGITKELDKRSCGYKRRLESITKATDLLEPMVRRILSYKIKIDFILMDSWFGVPKVITALRRHAHVICMVKKTSKILYGFDGLKLDVKAIYRRLKKRRGKAKILSNAIVTLSDGKRVKLVFVRHRRKKDWLVLLSTNIELADEDVVRLYGRRWDIEVCFKMSKQHLKLVKEVQVRDYDSMIAHTTIVFMRYQFLSYKQRLQTDSRTFGQLFYACCEELSDISFMESLHRILTLAIDQLRKAGEYSEDVYRKLIDAIMGQAVEFFGFGKEICQRSQAVD